MIRGHLRLFSQNGEWEIRLVYPIRHFSCQSHICTTLTRNCPLAYQSLPYLPYPPYPPYSTTKKERSTWNTPLILHYFSTLSAKFHQQHIDICRRNSRYSTSLAYGLRADPRQLLACLDRERLHCIVIEI